MELRSTGNPDTSNPAAMSMLEYLRKKGVEAMGMTNSERIRDMADEELARFLSEFSACNICEQFDKRLDRCGADNHFVCVKEYAEAIIGDWLKQPVEEEMQKSLTVPELVKLLNTESNKYGASGKPRELSLKVNGEYIGYVSSAKLDGWGDGLITDVCLELETE